MKGKLLACPSEPVVGSEISSVSSSYRSVFPTSAYRTQNVLYPSIIQVRFISSCGLFKGCLLVTDDDTICPLDSIVFRESMRKAMPSSHTMFVYD